VPAGMPVQPCSSTTASRLTYINKVGFKRKLYIQKTQYEVLISVNKVYIFLLGISLLICTCFKKQYTV
jgi:hypothetical protein